MNRINMMGLPDLPMAANDNLKAQARLTRWKAAGGRWTPVIDRITQSDRVRLPNIERIGAATNRRRI